MIGIIRIEYLVICPIDVSKATLEKIALDLEESIIKEETLKDLGINIDDFTNDLF